MSIPTTDIAYRVLRLEQQRESYHRLHATELEDIRRALAHLREEILHAANQSKAACETGAATKSE